MRWRGQRQSRNVEDRRGQRRPLGLPIPRGKGGLIGLAVILGGLYFGVDPALLLMLVGGGGGGTPTTAVSPQDDELAQMTSVVLADTETFWHQKFAEAGKTYQEPTLVLYRGSTSTHCGRGQAAMGPFYCPADQQIYIDLSFYDDMRTQLGAPGDFAQAYVVAHEVGHHIQTLLGTSAQVRQRQQAVGQAEANALSVRLELQADCYAGAWGHYLMQQNRLEPGDIEEALGAAQAIGDDRLQRRSQGTVVPDSFTHGTSAQRLKWFQRGMENGNPADCDTFSVAQP
ncbi:KPN_02809 family neutral zinc metallopeptidase [Ferrimonas balearica]|uniref:KPN_02809 family neutral zinc metallopeptidase n=1 Tax=Ferrimonas balearica TaxID=44012 RepID=UPI001C58B636|nr:neutral zinc metallopeptidase [Ferrimonas balearica]MBW3163150.1 zinc metallopeptidase [Ferrimonas balearica]MBY5980839.1 zinc metallopeptidase [Ferrimonas balearica]MBY6223096.1 zinc metallopeptidase [Ferrimonas balearica]